MGQGLAWRSSSSSMQTNGLTRTPVRVRANGQRLSFTDEWFSRAYKDAPQRHGAREVRLQVLQRVPGEPVQDGHLLQEHISPSLAQAKRRNSAGRNALRATQSAKSSGCAQILGDMQQQLRYKYEPAGGREHSRAHVDSWCGRMMVEAPYSGRHCTHMSPSKIASHTHDTCYTVLLCNLLIRMIRVEETIGC